MVADGNQDLIVTVVELTASPSRVWRALTDFEEFGAWFGVCLDGAFEVGKTTTGILTHSDQKNVPWTSVTESMEPERLFVFSWHPSAVDPDTPYETKDKITVEFELAAVDGGTRLTIRESGFLVLPESKRQDILQSITAGWAIQAANIAAHVRG